MTKALVIGCGDPRMDAEIPKVKSIVQTDEVVPYRFHGPDGIFSNPDRAEEIPNELAGIESRMEDAGPFECLAVLGHTDCAKHQVCIDKHRKDIQLTAMQIRDRLETQLPVQAILAIRGMADDDWVLEDWGSF